MPFTSLTFRLTGLPSSDAERTAHTVASIVSGRLRMLLVHSCSCCAGMVFRRYAPRATSFCCLLRLRCESFPACVPAFLSVSAYMSSPSHIELVLSEKEVDVSKEVREGDLNDTIIFESSSWLYSSFCVSV